MNRRLLKNKKGFTLIELLVVIAIIGVLASIVLASLNTARRKGRDTRRVADVGQIRLALELYFDSSRSYPPGTQAALAGLVSPTYIAQVPADPLGAVYSYQAHDNTATPGVCGASPCAGYILRSQLEDATNQAFTTDIDGTVATIDCSDNNGVSPDANRYYCQRN